MHYDAPYGKFEIYFSDLNEETQKRILEFYGVKSPEEMNWDVFPIATLENY